MRGDLYNWDVDAGNPVNGGSVTDSIVNPKFTAAFGPWNRTEFYVGAGGGFHSNDGRGSTLTVDCGALAGNTVMAKLITAGDR